MPGRDYTRAYARFEQSLRNSSTSHTNDIENENKRDPEGDALRDAHTTRKAFKQDGKNIDSRADMKTPPALTYCSVGLPPTPPSNTRSNKSFAFTNTSLPSYKSHLAASSSRDANDLLTPDTTPHESAEGLSIAGGFPLSSPYPESFRTALEEQWSPYMNPSRSRYFSTQTFRSTPLQERAEIIQASRKTQNISPAAIAMEQDPIHVLRSKADVASLSELLTEHGGKLKPFDGPSTLEANPNVGRGVSSWRNSVEVQPTATHITDKISIEDEAVPLLMRGLSQRKSRRFKRQTPQSSLGNVVEYGSQPSATANSTSDSRADLNKRFSEVSNMSTVVRALIQDHTPPAQKRKLRHSPKHSDLREQTLPNEASGRSSEEFNHRRSHGLVHKDQQLPSRQDRQSLYSVYSANVDKDQPLPSKQNRSSLDSERFAKAETRILRHTGNLTPQSRHSEPRNESPEDYLDSHDIPTINFEADVEGHVANARHKSIDHTINENDVHRRSSDYDRAAYRQSLFWPLKSSSPYSFRPHDLGSTPLSFQSEGMEALSVNEATTVNIYPHNNGSLLVVEQGPATNPLHRHPVITSDSDMEGRGTHPNIELPRSSFSRSPGITINTSAAAAMNRDLANTPTFSIIPPTPSEEVDIDESLAAFDKPQAANVPSRGSSILRRARQYSDGIFRPIITFTATNKGSLRRSIMIRKYYWNSRRHVSSSRRAELSDPDNNLHPFWQPRAFWDGLSEDGSTDGEDVPEDEAEDNLPAGGDTSDDYVDPEHTQRLSMVAIPASGFSKWRRSGRSQGSFRGFLIGNSLGIERGPTNRRRHVVRWPTGRKKRRVAGDMGGSGPKTMQVDPPTMRVANASVTTLGSTSSAVMRMPAAVLGSKGAQGFMGIWKRRFVGERMKW